MVWHEIHISVQHSKCDRKLGEASLQLWRQFRRLFIAQMMINDTPRVLQNRSHLDFAGQVLEIIVACADRLLAYVDQIVNRCVPKPIRFLFLCLVFLLHVPELITNHPLDHAGVGQIEVHDPDTSKVGNLI